MLAKIDRDGFLCLNRAGNYKRQACAKDRSKYCGDECALFREPKVEKLYEYIPEEAAFLFGGSASGRAYWTADPEINLRRSMHYIKSGKTKFIKCTLALCDDVILVFDEGFFDERRETVD